MTRKGIFCIFAASVAYGIMPVFSTQLLRSGMNSQSVIIFRFAFASLGALVLLCFTRTPLRVTRRQLWQLTFFGICGYGATALLLTCSYQYLPIGIATMFHFSYPLLVTVIMAVFYREKLTVWKVLAVLSALCGMVLMADFSAGGMQAMGILLALCSSLTYAMFVVANLKSSFAPLPPLVISFYSTVSLSLFFLVQALATVHLTLPPPPAAWGYSAAVGWICSLFALCMLNAAIRAIGATRASIGNLLEPLTSLIAGAVIYGDRIGSRAISGCALVLLAVLLVALDGRFAPSGEKVPAGAEKPDGKDSPAEMNASGGRSAKTAENSPAAHAGRVNRAHTRR